MTPTLSAVRAKYPDAIIWVVVRKGCEDILAGCPVVDKVLTATGLDNSRRGFGQLAHDIRLLRQLRQQQFDIAFDLSGGNRGRCLAWLSGASRLCTNDTVRPLSRWWRHRFHSCSRFNWEFRHAVEKDYFTVQAALPLAGPIPPLIFEKQLTEPSEVANEDFIVIHPGTRWPRKEWPTEYWVDLGKQLMKETKQLVISCGPNPAEVAEAEIITQALGNSARSTGGRLSWAQLAGLLHRARLFVGVDTAAMHLAAACRCPTVALFCDVWHHPWSCQWKPWRVEHHILHAGAGEITPDSVLQASLDLTRPIPWRLPSEQFAMAAEPSSRTRIAF